MTLGGMFMIVAAFGTIERPFSPISSAVSIKKFCPGEWQAIVQRAMQRLSTLESGCDGKRLSGLVAQPLLLRLLRAHVAAVDQQTALGLLDQIFHTQVDRHLLEQYPHLGQQQLF